MDALTHLFLPMTAVYVLRTDLFADAPWLLGLAGFGLLPDFDKFLGVPGLLHSLVTLVPVGLAVLGVEYALRRDLVVGPVVVALVFSHLVLDVVDGGPVPLLFPFVEGGLGLEYPVRTVFGEGPLGVSFEGPLVTLREATPRPGFNTYGFLGGAGVSSALLFLTVYLGDRLGARGGGTS
ncbi:metal-dependent hydrolase [Halomarina litorea]|uniref:metal-dependent hydrolase n=1 Tax=Halomarina litorea TaxID=2961595 RepID=UPI0020C5A0DB|nr:metal-dependent hydrolase [Halomarina sp. BCD28]